MLNPKVLGEQSKLTDETNKQQQQQNQSNSFLKPHDNYNNKNQKNSKHIKTSKSSHSIHNHSNVSPASVSPPYNDNTSNKRKAHHGGNGHSKNNYQHNESQSNNDMNTMNVDTIEDEFDFESNLAMFDKNKFYEEVGQPILNNSAMATPNEPQLNAYDSLIKQMNSSKQERSSSGTIFIYLFKYLLIGKK